MSKVIQNIRRQEKAGIIPPIISPNDDHTTGWDNNAIYKNEFYVDTANYSYANPSPPVAAP